MRHFKPVVEAPPQPHLMQVLRWYGQLGNPPIKSLDDGDLLHDAMEEFRSLNMPKMALGDANILHAIMCAAYQMGREKGFADGYSEGELNACPR